MNNSPRYKRAPKGKKGKGKFDPQELDKPLLDENSLEEEYAERTFVYKAGKKTKPKNINKKPKKSKEANKLDRHPPRPQHDAKAPPNRMKRVFVSEEGVKWPNRTIPYEIDTTTYTNATNIKSIFSTAVDRFNEAGCLQWIPRTTETEYIRVVGNEARCASYVGHLGWSQQTLWMYESGCIYIDISLHEMLHAAGTMHEQSRAQDRNRLLSFNWAAVSSGNELNYQGYSLYNAREYDLSSVLQYGLTYGSTTYMYVNDPDLEYLTQIQQTDLSFYDKAELNAFYQCADDCKDPPVCQNGGFVKQINGVCSCECVDGLTGPDCTELDTSPECGGLVNLTVGSKDKIEMFGYQVNLSCTWLIKGPEKTKIKVEVDSLDLPTSDQDNCYHYIEIRDYLSGTEGKLICGDSGGAVFTKKNLGPTNMMVVRFDSEQYSTVTPGKGFSMTVTADPSACSSLPCKYPATCVDGATTEEYTCVCTEGYSGTNCDTVAATATVTDSFEDDFTTLMTHSSTGVDFQWSTNKYSNLNGFTKTASDGDLMATLRNNLFATAFYYTYRAKLETSAVFERANRCLRFDYAIADNNVGDAYPTTLTVRVFSDSGTSSVVFDENTGNDWTTGEVDLPAVDNMKIEFEGVYGFQHLIVDNIRVTPNLCNKGDPCGNVCQNGGICELIVDSASRCKCPLGFTGEFCQNDLCASVDCNQGICEVLSESQTQCNCSTGWFGEFCDVDPCENTTCKHGSCEGLSDNQTKCNCEEGWFGELCTLHACEVVNCNHGSCEVVSETETRCNCTPGWFGEFCDVDPCANVICNQGSCEILSENHTHCICDEGWFGTSCNIDPCSNTNCNNGQCEALLETQTQCNCDEGWEGDMCDSQMLVTYKCDFETEIEETCFLVESTDDDYDFTREMGSTLTERTGPDSAYNGSYFKYAEASNHFPGDVASLESNVNFNAGTYCLSLAINMKGSHVGSLSILTKDGYETIIQQKFKGKQSKNWFLYAKELSLSTSTKIIIETVRGGSNIRNQRGDIAVDDIQLTSSPCPTTSDNNDDKSANGKGKGPVNIIKPVVDPFHQNKS